VPHSYTTAGRDAKIDWKALSQRVGHADVAFAMKRYAQADFEGDRQLAITLAELIIGDSLSLVAIEDEDGTDRPMRPDHGQGADQDPVYKSVYRMHAEGPFRDRKGPLTCYLVAGAGFEPATSGL
jgi:hypothetical protein